MTQDTRQVIAQQFADDFLLVAMNDYDTYNELREEARNNDTITLADKLREEWEGLAEQVTDLVEEKISPTASLFIAQMLKGQGQLPFDLIAREVMAQVKEEANA
jgi:hypothetical protein